MSNSEPSTIRDLPMSHSAPSPVEEAPTSGGESNPIRDAITQAIDEHKVILFMKGTPEAPACGFSARTVAALQSLEAPFAAVDILPDPRIRQELSAISNWPTIPQLFVDGGEAGSQRLEDRHRAGGEAARGRFRAALHEQDHRVLVDRFLDRVAHRVGRLVAHWLSSVSGVRVWIERAWMRSPSSDPNTS